MMTLKNNTNLELWAKKEVLAPLIKIEMMKIIHKTHITWKSNNSKKI